MTTIQGSISKLVDNSKVLFDSLGYVTSNIANYNTNFYKSQRFEAYMTSGGTTKGVERIDFSQGVLMQTSRDLDVALDGSGFIPVTNNKGQTAYTRGGSFSVNSEGYLVTSNNWLVGSGIKLPANYERIKIKPDGTFQVLDAKEGAFKDLGKIPIVVFKNPEGLEVSEGGIIKPTEESGKPELVLDHTKIKQGKIEKANVDPYSFVNETLMLNGGILSSSRFIKAIDNIYRESISLR